MVGFRLGPFEHLVLIPVLEFHYKQKIGLKTVQNNFLNTYAFTKNTDIIGLF